MLDKEKNDEINEAFTSLARQIKEMLRNKKNFSDNLPAPENISKKAKKVLEDIEINHDTSMIVELYLRNIDNMDKIAINYRGRKISYREMFANTFKFAKSFKAMGINKGDEVPVMVSNSPEFTYAFFGLNLIGAKMNSFGSCFNQNYVKDIIEKSGSNVLIASDDHYGEIKDTVNNIDSIKNVVLFSLDDSFLKDDNGNRYNPYEEIDAKFDHFVNQVPYYKMVDSKNIINKEDFLEIGKDYFENVVADCTLSDAAAVTYTSGTTRPGYPKGCIHSNRNYVVTSRFKAGDVSGMPSMKHINTMASLPTYTQTVLTTGYTDPLFLGFTVSPEPYYDDKFFPYSVVINKPNEVVATPPFLIRFAKTLEFDEKWINVKMPYLMLAVAVGQGTVIGEEKFFNLVARKHNFGIEKLKLFTATLSFGGLSSENGAILTTLFKALQEKRLSYLLHKEHMNLKVLPFAEVEVLNDKLEPCKVGEPGMLVANSGATQIGYVNEKLNENMNLKDANGKDWYDGGVYAIKDRFGDIRVIGRPSTNIKSSNGMDVPLYVVEDVIEKDTKNIMSLSIIKPIDAEDENIHVCHIEKQPYSKLSDEQVLNQCVLRLQASDIDEEILNNLYFRFRSFDESFEMIPCGKTDIVALKNEGIDEKCISYQEAINKINNKEKQKVYKKNK